VAQGGVKIMTFLLLHGVPGEKYSRSELLG
jgi:hypothetical protein